MLLNTTNTKQIIICWYMQQLGWIWKVLCWVEKASLKGTSYDCTYITLLKLLNYQDEKYTRACQLAVRNSQLGRVVGLIIKEFYEGDFCGNRVVLYLDYGVGYTNLHYGTKWHRRIQVYYCTNVKFLVLIFYNTIIMENLTIGGNCVKNARVFSIGSSQLSLSL